MEFKSSIFDLDGTLLNTLDDLANTANAMLKHFHYPIHPINSYRYFVGDGLRLLIERCTPEDRSSQQILECENVFKQLYADHWADRSCLYDEVDIMLQDLKKLGLQLAILSNKPDVFVGKCVDHFFPANCFSCVYGQREGVPKKPDPDGALIIAEELKVNPADILFVGDTATDMQTGKNAGMKTVGVLWGFRDLQELQKCGADHIVSHPREIVELCR
jgi:phosphoglycolate phosphatase